MNILKIHTFLIWLHKKKIESDSIAHKTELEKFNSKIKLKDSEIYGYRTKNEQCKRELQSCHNTDDGAKEPPKADASEVSGLKQKIEEMQKKLEEQENNSNSMAAILKGGAIEHYTQNETAHFQRVQKANEPLFFDRGNIQHHVPDKLMMGRQLAQTLEEVKAKKMADKEQLDKHPMDRENQGEKNEKIVAPITFSFSVFFLIFPIKFGFLQYPYFEFSYSNFFSEQRYVLISEVLWKRECVCFGGDSNTLKGKKRKGTTGYHSKNGWEMTGSEMSDCEMVVCILKKSNLGIYYIQEFWIFKILIICGLLNSNLRISEFPNFKTSQFQNFKISEFLNFKTQVFFKKKNVFWG
ncbi:Protein CBG03677 [Caenorhabditis briggsae]|uniref:Protein CBG03677 n=1 Tax=Caenorhabditis briggsae TaxID=6238 RepID=A8WVK6_CAEBR|nr:Protein CBG03677 [Caenorhabditis briggsae]CAP24517.1 Protein CBG03677 [Caenorhabditis briggsae]